MSSRKSFILGFALALIVSVGLLAAPPVFAQTVDFEAFAETAGFTTDADIIVIIARLIRTAITLTGIITVGFMIYGGFVYMTAGGDAGKIQSAKKIITNSIIGLIIVFSSFAITQFLLNALTDATSSSITSSSDTDYSFGDGDGSGVFYLSSVNTECSTSLQNLQLQFVFSKRVASSTVSDGILVEDSTGTAVDGSFDVSGYAVTFTPDQACDSPYEDYNCFDANEDYSITLNPLELEATNGSSLTCLSAYPCSYSFTTGEGVDIADPTVEMDAPEDGESVIVGDIELLQALTTDDTGVSTTHFYVIDDDEAVYSSGVDYSSEGALTGGDAANYFFTDDSIEWDSTGYTTNAEYRIWAEGVDCAGNSDIASVIEVVLRAANCANGVLDEDYETGIDCGGDSSSANYCGACEGDVCEDNSDCSSGRCEDGTCVDAPKIDSVSPGDGAPGNLVTIAGEGFGDGAGSVTFLGTESGDEVVVSAYECNATVQWDDEQIIVQVPDAAVDGPIEVETAEGDTERTDDDYGVTIVDFDVNAIERPGVCMLDPDEDEAGEGIDVHGNSFGDDQGSSTLYFTNYETSSYVSWSDTLLDVVVPNVNSGYYNVAVYTGDFVCVDSLDEPTGETCSDDADCGDDESCATTWCSESLKYCDEDDDCGEGGGTCESIRVGSNEVRFTVEDASTGTTPIISSVDTGWKACSGGADDGDQCAEDSDCDSGACEDASNWGPPGQYVTIYGTNFGTATGTVYFENESLGYEALADTDFPDYCSEDFWYDTYITVKVPEVYQNDETIEFTTHNLYIVRQDSAESDTVDFVVRDDEPGPSVCDIDPSAGPEGTEVTVYGERFGSTDGTVTFYDEVDASAAVIIWDDEELNNVFVPTSAVTGPVYVVTGEGYESNSFTFAVGNCNEQADLCSEGEECCADGTCSTSCLSDDDVSSHYAYRISTATIPDAPQVVIECDLEEGVISPSVWEGWTDAEDTCLNVAVTATFDMAMNTSSLNTTNVVVEKCILNEEEDDPDADDDTTVDSCVQWEAITASGFSRTVLNFNWYPPLNGEGIPAFDADSWYRVTLNGGEESGAIQAHTSAGAAYMEEDFQWEFFTSDASDLCDVGDVNTTPSSYTSVEEDEEIDYLAQLVAANDECQVLACTGYTLEWDSSDDGAVIDDPTPGSGVCENVVRAEEETPSGNPAEIEAEVTNSDNAINPSDDASLIINFLDPEIEDYFPDCSTACINALPFAVFNTNMDWGSIGTSTVSLYECEDSLCDPSELTDLNSTLVASVTQNSGENRLEINFDTGEYLESNTWHRIVLDGDDITSFSGVPLSESGSNYGSSENQYYPDDFSWVFKTKESDVTCGVDSVSVSPNPAEMSYVGERSEFNATAFGAPDDCDVDGQALQGSSYDWSAWTAVDDPNAVGADEIVQEEVVAYMLVSGEIELTNDLPDWCSTSCLNVGSAVQSDDAVCGDGVTDTSAEECDDGNTTNGDGCSDACLFEGSDACEYACDTSGASCSTDSDCEETCTDGECSISGDSCATDDGSDCPYFSGDTCEISSTGTCCGDGIVASGVEECDDGNFVSGDGCSASCLNEGSSSVGATCGDGTVDQSAGSGGEDCDDGNTVNGDGCSAQCLFEGGVDFDDVYAICGNSIQEDGEDCDDGNNTDGDGCSSWCLNEGTQQCVLVCSDDGSNCSTDADCGTGATCDYYDSNCCGNSVIDDGEDCDGAEGCSDSCLNQGSSVHYNAESYCGDGDDSGTGEECDATSSATYAVGAYGVGEVADGAPLEVVEGYAYSIVTATADGVEGEATLALECSCTTDSSCDNGSGLNLGCGAGSCCFERPTIGDMYPAENISSGIPTGPGHCRNTAIYVEFDANMDLTTFDPTVYEDGSTVVATDDFEGHVYLDLVSADGVAVTSSGTCPDEYTKLVFANEASGNIFVRAWRWVSDFVLGLFGRDVSASASYACMMPISFEESALEDGERVYVRYTQLLEENAHYRLVVYGDDDAEDSVKDGVLTEHGVTLCIGSSCGSGRTTQQFYIGDEVCELEYVGVEDLGDITAASYETGSPEFFTQTDEEHEFESVPYTYRNVTAQYEEISPISSIYEWEWAWGSDTAATEDDDVVGIASGDLGDDTNTNFTASGNDGTEQVIATATITADTLFDPSTEDEYETGTLDVTALLCENPWPELDSVLGFPYVETSENTNFSFYYCRDAGEEGTDDDLPALGEPIDVTSLASAGILQEVIFQVEGTSDAIGVRVIPNSEYLSPQAWVEDQEFTGTFDTTELDGYKAVEAGTTIYASAANQDSGTLYSNMYIVSYNDDAGDEAGLIFEEILENWSFNANESDVSDVNLCAISGDYVVNEDGNYISCEWDGGCYETCETGSLTCQDYSGSGADTGEACEEDSECNSGSCSDDGVCTGAADVGESCSTDGDCGSNSCASTCSISGDECFEDSECPLYVSNEASCDAEKSKLTRDMNRLTDITDMIATFEQYGERNGYCSVTRSQSCDDDTDCPGEEECLSGYPDVQSGTFVPAVTNSMWASWSAVLGNELQSALPLDPINEFYNCDEDGYDDASCWNGATGTFICPVNSHLYGYQSSGGESYTLYTVLESSENAVWSAAIDTSASDDVTVVAEYVDGNAPSATVLDGFERTAQFCDANTWGDSTICGDGIQGSTETCEIGDTDVISCVDGTDTGVMTVTCKSDCSGFQSQSEAEAEGATCSPYECGNGIIEDTEQCDDGELNGTYGYCGDLCTVESGFYCGDGFLAGGEECDCGTTSTFDTVIADGNSWAVLGPDLTGTTSSPWCDTSNGQYNADITTSCAYNCTAPGPSCGDNETNGDEECDGDYQEHAGGLCADGYTACDTDSDCADLDPDSYSDFTCGSTYASCGVGDACADYDDVGDSCETNAECDSGSCVNNECEGASDVGTACSSSTGSYLYSSGSCESGSCPDFDYDLFRYRNCDGSCEFPLAEDGHWSYCVGGDQICGNGEIEGTEECDDGNDSNNDACTNECQLNVCGDDHVYVGVESCDNGSDNGELCEAGYEDTCNYCNNLCQYKTLSGGFCGDGEVNGNEYCDGDEISYSCFDDSAGAVVSGSCDATDNGSQGSCATGYTCRWTGVCNGGVDHGDPCTLQFVDGVGVTTLTSGSDTEGCTSGACVAPTCADNCGSQCPFSYETTGILVVSELEGAEATDSIDLYSYQNDEGNAPDNAALYIPACNVATKIEADVTDEDRTLPDVDIVFVTDLSGSMENAPDGSSAIRPNRRIDFVADATKDAIEDLLDVYAGYAGSTLEVGLVSYQSSSAEDDLLEAGYSSSLSSNESALTAIVDNYADEPGGGTPTAAGMEAAINILNTSSSADVRIVVLLSDGDPSYDSSGGSCSSSSESWNAEADGSAQSASGTEACPAEVRYDSSFIAGHPNYTFYSAVISDDDDLIGYMAHQSSEECDGFDMSDADECGSGTYAFAATTEEEIAEMYQAIVDSILNTTVTVQATDDEGNTTTTTDQVEIGSGSTIPFPNGFVCQNEQQTIPLRNTFYGDGSLNFSNFELTYCPY